MEIRDSLSKKIEQHPKGKHRHPRPKFNPATNRKRIEYSKDEPDWQKIFFQKADCWTIDKFKASKQLRITLNQQDIGFLNRKFINLYESISRSKYILDFKDDWDENGSKGYLPSTWIKAIRFLIKFYTWRDQNLKPLIKSPKIYQGPDGSIDLYWKTLTFTYLINIPEERGAASFFYKTASGSKTEGEFDLQSINIDELPAYFEPSFV